ncbi:CAP domain-containing protein [Nereida sp.]|uniref:CAP domain-containing protein n=1 Tax=Nereida sp. TaxID=2736090 RepID=UPI003F69F890
MRAKLPGSALFDSAVLHYVNKVRCSKGLSALTFARGLVDVAEVHLKWMAKSQQLNNKSCMSAMNTFKKRLKASGVGSRAGSENIGVTRRYQLETAGVFLIRDLSACRFGAKGRTIPAHSYKSLANHIVNMWMASSGHRQNILARRSKRTGALLAFDGKSPNCGRYFITQNFAG